MRETFVQTGDEQFDANLFDKYANYLSTLIKIDKNLLSKMDDQQKTVLFYNFFKMIQEAVYENFDITISEYDDILSYSTLLIAKDKAFAKKLADYTNQYFIFVYFQIKKQEHEDKKKIKILERYRKEIVKLAKYIANPDTFQLIALGHADEYGKMIDFRQNKEMYERMKNVWNLRDIISKSGLFKDEDASRFSPVPNISKTEYNNIARSFNPDIFYNLSESDIENALCGLVSGYCAMNKISAPHIKFKEFADAPGKITYGTYVSETDTIYMNKKMLAQANQFRGSKDPTIPMRIIQTGIHEADHKRQLAYAIQNNNTSQYSNSNYKSFGDYLSDPDEVIARYNALKSIQRFAQDGVLDESTYATIQKLIKEEEMLRQRSSSQGIYQNYKLTSSATQQASDEPEMSLFAS